MYRLVLAGWPLAQLSILDDIDTFLGGGGNKSYQQQIQATFDQLYDRLLDGPLFHSIVSISSLIGATALGIFGYQLWKRSKDGNLAEAFEGALFSIIIVALLANNAALWRDILQAERHIINTVNETIITQTIEGENARTMLREAKLKESTQLAYETHLAQCRASPRNEQKSRRSDLCETEARQYADSLERSRREAASDDREDLSLFGVVFLNIIALFLNYLQTAFQMIIEVALMLASLLSPFVLAASVIPSDQRPLLGWQSIVIRLGATKLSFNLIAYLVVFIYLNSDGAFTGLLLPIALGVLGPLLAVAIGNSAGTGFLYAVVTVGGLGSLGTARRLVGYTLTRSLKSR